MAYEKKMEKCERDCGADKMESACVPDCKSFKTFRDKPVVKSVKTDDKIGGVNESAWYFQNKGEKVKVLFMIR